MASTDEEKNKSAADTPEVDYTCSECKGPMLKGVFYDCDECAFTSESKEEEENEEGKIFCYQCDDPYTKRVYWCCNACNYSRTENSWLSSSLIKSRKE